MKSRWITHHGKKIGYADYAGFLSDHDALFHEIDASDDVVCQQPPNTVLAIVDLCETFATMVVVEYLKKSSTRTQQNVRKMAVVGISGARKILYKMVIKVSGQQHTRDFDDLEAAKAWVVME